MTAAYQEYRDANSRWVDRIPAHWRIERLKFVARPQASNVDKHSKDDEIPVRLCNYTDVYNNAQITADMDFMEATATEAEIEKFTLTDDEVIITKDSESWEDIAVPTHVPKAIEGVLCGYHLTQIRPDKEQLDGRYLYYQLCSAALNRQFQVKANGVTRFGLPAYHIDNAETIVPKIAEQRAIAHFLDTKTTEIDELIGKREALLVLQREQRIAMITHAVTRGLNGSDKLSRTSIPWLEAIPSHWRLVPLKWCCRIASGQVDPTADGFRDLPLIAPDHIESWTGRILPFTSAEEQGAISGKYAYTEGTLLYSKIRPELSKVCIAPVDGLCSADMYAISPNEEILTKFLFYQFLSRHFHQFAVLESMRVAMPKVNREALGAFPILVPPRDEQEEIVQYLDQALSALDKSSCAIRTAINHLLEYRSAVITAAVTGQIKVV